ncbi:hypothetical protein [Novosphingobium sp. ST904]|uniref:hypothetical protein n=1 Tax=Novosphingobium sp. ST904 TaxID=1684385 RepID=UPI0006C8B7A0|nr:hypothetical protein [Novosphingobium sp. ST904]TCM33173.1 hypothetical protein EDF59_12064 [Novosphingobium sp. ST904]
MICPWRWIGLTRLWNVLGMFEHAGQVVIVHHAFRLMPGVAPRLVEEVIVVRMGIAAGNARRRFGRSSRSQPLKDCATGFPS